MTHGYHTQAPVCNVEPLPGIDLPLAAGYHSVVLWMPPLLVEDRLDVRLHPANGFLHCALGQSLGTVLESVQESLLALRAVLGGLSDHLFRDLLPEKNPRASKTGSSEAES